MTTLATGIDTVSKSCFASIQGRVYMSNDFDAVKVWDGVSATAIDAGIVAPSAAPSSPAVAGGVVTAGAHLIRYRYLNSTSLYVSNPSPSLSYTVPTGGQTLTFTVGTHMTASADGKVSTIVLEATTAGGTAFYRVGTCTNVNGQSVVYNMPDTILAQGDLVGSTTGDFGHEQPPLFSVVCSHAGRLFGGGSTTRSLTVGVTNGSATVTGTGFSLKWAGRRIKFGSESVTYQIASVASSTSMSLSVVYGNTTNAAASASVFSGTPNRLFWSTLLYPEGWKPAAYARDVMNNRSDELRGLASFLGDLWVFGRYSSERLMYTSDPGTAEGQLIPIPGDRGVINNRCLVEADGVLYAWDRQGMYQCGARPLHMSRAIDRTLVDYVDWTYADDFHGVYDPTDRVLMWFFTKIGDTQPKWAACYDADGKHWSLAEFKQPITATRVVPDSDGQVRAMLGDGNGHTWYFGIEGGRDGLAPGEPPVVTINGTATATVIPVNEFITGYIDGVSAYDPALGQTAIVQTNTTSTITLVSPGFTSIPADGSELWLGIIPWEYRSKWFTFDGARAHPVYLNMRLYPTATGNCRVYVYKEFSSVPEVVSATADDVFPDGVTVVDGLSYITVSLDGGSGDGVISIPMPFEWAHHWQARIVCDRPEGEIRLMDLTFSGEVAKPSEAQP